jgi:hypothetical protein
MAKKGGVRKAERAKKKGARSNGGGNSSPSWSKEGMEVQ